MTLTNPFFYFTDSILRAPTIGCMLMCLSASLVGVIALLRKQALVGEALSHAAFPGVILGVVVAGAFSGLDEAWIWLPAITMAGAFLSSSLGLACIQALENKLRVRVDSALCFILSGFFGIGMTLASRVQFTHTTLYKQSLTYLYGQAATMVDSHAVVYGILSFFVIATVITFYKEIQVLVFDKEYAKSIGVQVTLIRGLIFLLVTLSIVIGVRSVGIVLMSAMLIAPAVAARQFTNRLSMMMLFAGLLGLASGFFGIYLSVELTNYYALVYPSSRLSIPTGPMIVLVASFFCVMALLFAPERGLLMRLFRAIRFRYRCMCENILKAMWRAGPEKNFSFSQIASFQEISSVYMRYILWRLASSGWIEHQRDGNYRLTADGIHRGAYIVRLHRLWELYLTDYLGMGVERVHRSAEEMEHIITPEIEKELTVLLNDPKFDPHHQPIPPLKG